MPGSGPERTRPLLHMNFVLMRWLIIGAMLQEGLRSVTVSSSPPPVFCIPPIIPNYLKLAGTISRAVSSLAIRRCNNAAVLDHLPWNRFGHVLGGSTATHAGSSAAGCKANEHFAGGC